MKITLLQENLLQALNDVKKALAQKPQLPILSTLLIEVSKEKVVISGTDLYLGIRSTIRGSVDEPGTIAVPGKVFYEVISSLRPGKVSLKLVEGKLHIKTSNTSSTLQTLSADEYPPFPEPGKKKVNLLYSDLESIMSMVVFSASSDETRPVLTSVLFNLSEKSEVVATDGFRLATLALDQSFEKISILIPARALREIFRIAKTKEVDQVTIAISQELKQLFVSFKGVEIYVRLMEGDFPPYQKIIPPSFKTELSFDAVDFQHYLKGLQVFARDASNIVTLEIVDQTVVLRATSPSLGTQESTLPVTAKSGDEGKIAFNIKYLLEFLAEVKPERVQLGMNDNLQPALFKPEGNKHYKYIVMPFKTN